MKWASVDSRKLFRRSPWTAATNLSLLLLQDVIRRGQRSARSKIAWQTLRTIQETSPASFTCHTLRDAVGIAHLPLPRPSTVHGYITCRQKEYRAGDQEHGTVSAHLLGKCALQKDQRCSRPLNALLCSHPKLQPPQTPNPKLAKNLREQCWVFHVFHLSCSRILVFSVVALFVQAVHLFPYTLCTPPNTSAPRFNADFCYAWAGSAKEHLGSGRTQEPWSKTGKHRKRSDSTSSLEFQGFASTGSGVGSLFQTMTAHPSVQMHLCTLCAESCPTCFHWGSMGPKA